MLGLKENLLAASRRGADDVGQDRAPRKKRWCEDIKDDIARRWKYYGDDWVSGLHPTTISASLFMFFASLFPALIFGVLLKEKTDGLLGITEVLLSTAITGITWSLFSGQPLVIVGVTAPVTIFMGVLFRFSKAFEIDYFVLHWWTCVWSALFHWLIASTGACSMVSRVTRFAGEIFGFFISYMYIRDALLNLFDFDNNYKNLDADHGDTFYFQHALVDGWLGFGCFCVAIKCHYARDWSVFNDTWRERIANYGTVMAIGLFTALSYWHEFASENPARLSNKWCGTEPGFVRLTARLNTSISPATAIGNERYCGETDGVVNLNCDERRFLTLFPAQSSLITAVIGMVTASILTVLFFFDHNVSSLLSQNPDFNLKKGSAYHYDFCVLGFNVLLCGLLGIPPTNGLIPQAPLHVRALATIKRDKNGIECYQSVRETRLSNCLQSILILAVLLVPNAVDYIPMAVLMGLYLYMGIASLDGNSLAERMFSFVQDTTRIQKDKIWMLPAEMDIDLAWMPTVFKYTAFQATCLVLITAVAGGFDFIGIKTDVVAIIFPVLIAVLIPIRERVLPRLFETYHLDVFLDGDGPIPENEIDIEASGGIDFFTKSLAAVMERRQKTVSRPHLYHQSFCRATLLGSRIVEEELTPNVQGA